MEAVWTDLDREALIVAAAVALGLGHYRTDVLAPLLLHSRILSDSQARWTENRLRQLLVSLIDRGFLEGTPGLCRVAPVEVSKVLGVLRDQEPDRLRTLARKFASEALHHRWNLEDLLTNAWLAVVAEDPGLMQNATTHLTMRIDDRFEPWEHPSPLAQTLAGFLVRWSAETPAWAGFPRELRLWLVKYRTLGSAQFGLPARDLPGKLRAVEAHPEVLAAVIEWEAVGHLMTGDLAQAREVGEAENLPSVTALAHWLGGSEAAALEALDEALSRIGPRTKGEGFLPGALFPLTACPALAHGRASASKVKSWATAHAPEAGTAAKILWSAFRHQGKSDAPELYRDDVMKITPLCPLDRLLMNWGSVWNGLGTTSMPFGPSTLASFQEFVAQGALWYAGEEARTLTRVLAHPEKVPVLQEWSPPVSLTRWMTDLVDAGSSWEAALKRLNDLKFDQSPGAKAGSAEVLAWLVDPSRATVEPVLRKALSSGWSTPKKAPLTKLGRGEHPSIQSDDRAALKAIVQGYYGWEVDHKRALESLGGHPRLFLASDVDVPLTLDAVEAELLLDETPGGLRFRFSTPVDTEKAVLTKVAHDHWQVRVVSDKVKKVAEVVGSGLTVPREARDRVVEVLGRLASGIQVRSPLLKESRQAVDVAADSRPVVLLSPRGGGVSVEVHVRPLGPGTPLLRPGEGPGLIHAKIGERLLTTSRDLKTEARNWRAVLAQCPDLDAGLGDWFLDLPDPGDALTILAELRDAEGVTVEWPQGGRVQVHRVSASALRLQVTQDHQWFSVEGTAVLEDRVVDFQELLAQGTGRFVQLAGGDWIELEAQLLRQLQHLATVSEASGKRRKLAPLALAGSELLLDEALTSAEPAIDRWRRKWKTGVSPNLGLPTSLRADLRPYQLEGFRWLARLAEMGAGACLADDMGLGKTLQAIAILAHRASEGPSLIVAPTSVAPNWIAEIRRFDQSLEPVLLSEGSRASRQAVVASLGPGQVLLATYGLLVTEDELLTGRTWNLVVLDEAQAVKNLQAKRTKAVLSLRAPFRLALTGTPLQNHLGELWTLFEFLNPGLLGTKTRFTDQFWTPIEVRGDEVARRSLQTLVRPFLLRRTKSQVLTELPDKIETTLAVDLSPDERAFYEALRRQALDVVSLQDKKPGEQQILILAQLMKLRRACCHPQLSGGPAAPSSSKLDLLEELLEGLIDNGHRTLVFSQFTDHLNLIQGRMEARGWAYERLDGSTPAQERGALVARFQAGTAPVFLISLLAGGTGLNLTAADYVVHMDPWWNPAVEDQASDRAHRLGQTRPVTIYRLVARDTIEEKIVALHKTKRDLADALLEGSEAAGRLGTEELLALISEAHEG